MGTPLRVVWGGKKDEYPDVIHEYWSKVLLQLLV